MCLELGMVTIIVSVAFKWFNGRRPPCHDKMHDSFTISLIIRTFLILVMSLFIYSFVIHIYPVIHGRPINDSMESNKRGRVDRSALIRASCRNGEIGRKQLFILMNGPCGHQTC